MKDKAVEKIARKLRSLFKKGYPEWEWKDWIVASKIVIDALEKLHPPIEDLPLLNVMDIENLETQDKTLDMSFWDDYRREVKVLLKAQRDLIIKYFEEG